MIEFSQKLFIYLVGLIVVITSCQTEQEALANNQWDLTIDEFEELVALCDTASLFTFEDFEQRIYRIQDIFAGHQDARGAFPTVYKAITHAAVVGLQNSQYNDPEYSLKFALDFSKRYLHVLEDHLYNRPLEYHWQVYYDHAQANTHITKMVLEGINAHLTIDLTRALAHTGVYPEFIDDWLLFGDNTVQSVPGFLEELQVEYDTDASDVFGVFFIGDLLDAFLGDGATINFGFNLLRKDAFDNALRLQNPAITRQIEWKMKQNFWDREGLIDLVDHMNMTPRYSE